VLIIKNCDQAGHWYLFSKPMNIGSGDDDWLAVDSNMSDDRDADWLDYYAPGFTVKPGSVNTGDDRFIYFAFNTGGL
jgi:hypothetical protein